MLTTKSLREEFAKDHQKHYSVPLFEREGFKRKTCLFDGKGYWTASDAPDCGDSSHTPYSFFKDKPVRYEYAKFWEKFADFFRKQGHSVIPRYPVLSRWRDDLYFTIASIVDFQRVENGKIVFEYPANPLVVPQMCLRFGDIANVGVTGRHMTGFMMAGQHAFNPPKQGYWKEECIELNYKFLRDVLQIPKEEIIYSEEVWNMPDFSAFGPSIESNARGAELVNSVFMQYSLDANGQRRELDTKVIDVGWGFERLLWYASGTLTAYDATFPREIEFMKQRSALDLSEELFKKYASWSATLDVETARSLREEKQKIAQELGISLEQMEKGISPLQGIYAIADHSRSLLFALNDGGIPSNAAGGYNLRVLARRCFNFIEEYGFDFDLFDVAFMHAQDLKPIYPELTQNLEEVQHILEAEKRKYRDSISKARSQATEIIRRRKPISVDEMTTLYESNGITPELLEKVARDLREKIEIPTEFYSNLTQKHVMEKREVKTLKEIKAPATRLLYYELQDKFETDAKIVAIHDKAVALDQTLLYPEGGGQACDTGWISERVVLGVEKIGDVVLHHLENVSGLREGQTVKVKVNIPRRMALRRHHSATHVLTGVCRMLLGNHAWQAGARKEPDIAHLDITHYEKLSPEMRNAIENKANEIVREARAISVEEQDRGKAEKSYGFRLYQGGGAISKRIRVLEVEGVDVEACGGLHAHNTQELAPIKIVGTEQVQDGIIRIYFKASSAAIEHIQKTELMLEEAAVRLQTTKEGVPAAVAKMQEEWKASNKALDKVYERMADVLGIMLAQDKTDVVRYDAKDASPKLCEDIANSVALKGKACIVENNEGFVVAAVPKGSQHSAVELLQKIGARGGGSPFFARGKKQ
ncbi:MAG TPA: alanine--tRNA ligase [Candidatus Norongarragalinales archaeon]|jgi:alanyl-tRNA synthetase|nr:alanine--tRNA ligase [Candidatus Norongarragalinales archaeon]